MFLGTNLLHMLARAPGRGYLAALVVALLSSVQIVAAAPSDSPEVVARRGKVIGGSGTEAPRLTLEQPTGGWTSSYMLEVRGQCSDATVDPLLVAINGVRYYLRPNGGAFSRKFPAARGENNVTVECPNKGGVAKASRTITGVMPPIPLKVVLTSDTDGVYTDLHLYEPDGSHVYWADTDSPSGGMFFLNQQGDSFDQPGYGPYLYVHPSPAIGVYRIDTNYWPGGAVQHTLANLDIVTNEGLPSEARRRVRRPLARPGETQTLAYVVVRPNGLPVKVFVPGQDDPKEIPDEVVTYQREVEPRLKGKSGGDVVAFLPRNEERTVRSNIALVALSQARQASVRWQREQRDCAGLVRFAYKEAVSPRTEEQVREIFYRSAPFPALRYPTKLLLPMYPTLWHTGYSSEGAPRFDFFADAETLLGYNFRLKARDVKDAEVGDILAFRKDLGGEAPYHLMIFGGPDSRRGVVVYHTGSELEKLPRRVGIAPHVAPPAVRVVRVSELMATPDPVWIPTARNPHFLGVFEWKRFRSKGTNPAAFVS
jgi:uncharacterized protein YfaT (DUF1175 family)/uncharacterized protein YfaP (DUF2135 family)